MVTPWDRIKAEYGVYLAEVGYGADELFSKQRDAPSFKATWTERATFDWFMASQHDNDDVVGKKRKASIDEVQSVVAKAIEDSQSTRPVTRTKQCPVSSRARAAGETHTNALGDDFPF